MLTVNPEIEQAHDSPIITSIAQLTDAELISHFAKREAVAYPALPKATESQLSNADEILVDRFTYTGETFQFEPGFSWMPNPSCDKEWQIAFHKHYFLIDLIQAYRHSCNIVYLQKVATAYRKLDCRNGFRLHHPKRCTSGSQADGIMVYGLYVA